MNTEELKIYTSKNDIEHLESFLKELKRENVKEFKVYLERLKLVFINSNDILLLNKIAMLFSEFKIHSSVSLIVAKLLSTKHDDEGGTLVYALDGLRKSFFNDDLRTLWGKKISYEMEQMLLMIGVDEE